MNRIFAALMAAFAGLFATTPEVDRDAAHSDAAIAVAYASLAKAPVVPPKVPPQVPTPAKAATTAAPAVAPATPVAAPVPPANPPAKASAPVMYRLLPPSRGNCSGGNCRPRGRIWRW